MSRSNAADCVGIKMGKIRLGEIPWNETPLSPVSASVQMHRTAQYANVSRKEMLVEDGA